MTSADYFRSNPAHARTDKMTGTTNERQTDRLDRITSALAEVTIDNTSVHSGHLAKMYGWAKLLKIHTIMCQWQQVS